MEIPTSFANRGDRNAQFNINTSQPPTYTDLNTQRHVVESQIPHGNVMANSFTPHFDAKFKHDPNFVNRQDEHLLKNSNVTSKYQSPHQFTTVVSPTQVKLNRQDENSEKLVDFRHNFRKPNQFHNVPRFNVGHHLTISPQFDAQDLTGQMFTSQVHSSMDPVSQPFNQQRPPKLAGMLGNNHNRPDQQGADMKHLSTIRNQSVTTGPSNFPTWQNVPHPMSGLPPTTNVPHPMSGLPPNSNVPHPMSGLPPTTNVPHPMSGLPPTTNVPLPVSGLPPTTNVPHPVSGLPPANIQQFPDFKKPPPPIGSCAGSALYSVPPPLSYSLGAENNSTNVTELYQSNYPKQDVHQSLSFNESKLDSIDTLKTKDKEWIQHWLENKGLQTKRHERENHLKIYEAQDKMKQLFVLMARLQKGMQTMEAMKNAEMKVWDSKFQEIEQVKLQIEELKKEFSNQQTLLQLKQRLSSRRKKRERRKRSRKEEYEQTQECRDVLHGQIDQWRNSILQKDRSIKQEKELKQEADGALTEVRKKISDMTKMISVLNGLKKLRKLRKDRQERQGLYTSFSNEQTFESSIEELLELAKKQQDTYHAEENALKVMLEEEHEESREKERLRSQQKELDREISEQRMTQELLFGLNDAPDTSSSLFPFYQYYDQANLSLQALLHIRHEWDMFLVPVLTPGGSRIPMAWVAPTEPTSDRWASALKCNQT